jgi:hypothetical protein
MSTDNCSNSANSIRSSNTTDSGTKFGRRFAVAASELFQEQLGLYKQQHQQQQQQQKLNGVNNLECSFYSLFDLLERKGVSSACILELRKQVKLGMGSRHKNNNNNNTLYVHVLEQCQKYIECIASNMIISKATTTTTTNGRHSSNSGDEASNTTTMSAILLSQTIDMESMNQMIITCWNQLCEYVSYQYKQAYRIYHNLREQNSQRIQEQKLLQQTQYYQNGVVAGVATVSNDDRVLSYCSEDHVGSEHNTIQLGDVQYNEQLRSYPMINLRNGSNSMTAQLERALNVKIQIAEECCSCQKGLLMAQSFERKQRQQIQRFQKQRLHDLEPKQ